MLAPPSLKNVLFYPVTAGVALAAIAVTGIWWSGQNIDGFVMNSRVCTNYELWRALTCTLPHVNFFHRHSIFIGCGPLGRWWNGSTAI